MLKALTNVLNALTNVLNLSGALTNVLNFCQIERDGMAEVNSKF